MEQLLAWIDTSDWMICATREVKFETSMRNAKT
jgi:hypothetical protein